MIIAVDFDGTCVTHEFPQVGRDIGAAPVLKELVDNGHQLILFTMRANVENVPSPEFDGVFTGKYLSDAVDWFIDNGIPLYGVQVNPTQHEWTTSPKCYAHLYIDDCALGCPLILDPQENRPYVDWVKVREMLVNYELIK